MDVARLIPSGIYCLSIAADAFGTSCGRPFQIQVKVAVSVVPTVFPTQFCVELRMCLERYVISLIDSEGRVEVVCVEGSTLRIWAVPCFQSIVAARIDPGNSVSDGVVNNV